MVQPVWRASSSSQPAFRRLRDHPTVQEPTTEEDADFGYGTPFSFFCLASGVAGYIVYEKFNECLAREQKLQEEIRDLKKYDIKELQEAVQKLDPRFEPGEAARLAERAEDDLRDKLRIAMKEGKEPVRVPDVRSKDTFEQVAAMYHDAEQKDRLKKIWDRYWWYFGKDGEEKIREELEGWGLRVPKKGNPFGDGGKGFWWFW
ncbi:MAG: hypothetical protein Q9208_001569 [Pyrenodesmia sp. 3 TL-2023]